MQAENRGRRISKLGDAIARHPYSPMATLAASLWFELKLFVEGQALEAGRLSWTYLLRICLPVDV